MRVAISMPILLVLASCTYRVVFPSEHLSILYPDGDTAYVPLQFQIMVASFSSGFGFHHEGFGGDVKSETRAYRQEHPPFAVYMDGEQLLVSDSPIVHISTGEGVHSLGVSRAGSSRIASRMVLHVVSDYPYHLAPMDNTSLGWVDSTAYRDSLLMSGSYVVCDSSALFVSLSGGALLLLERGSTLRSLDYPDGFIGLACVDGHARTVSVVGDSLRAGDMSFPVAEALRNGYVSMLVSGSLVLASSGRGLWIFRDGRWLRAYVPLRYADVECTPAGVGFVVVGILPIPIATLRARCHSPNPAVDIYGNYLHVDGFRYRIERRER